MVDKIHFFLKYRSICRHLLSKIGIRHHNRHVVVKTSIDSGQHAINDIHGSRS